MNERIRELAEQAGADFMRRINYNNLEGKEYEEDAGVIFESTESFEKFAELIVAECIQVSEAHAKDLESQPTDPSLEAYEDGVVNGIYEATEAIKEHFGVKE